MSLTHQGMASIGLEFVQTWALLQVIDNLPSQLNAQSAAWAEYDREIATRIGVPFRQTRLERPPQKSYYSGVRLGIIGMPWDSFPTVATMVDRAQPTPENNSFDQSTYAFAPQLYIESVVRSDAFHRDDAPARVEQEGVVDRRAKRMLEALFQSIALDPSLGGNLPELPAPVASQTDAFDIDGVEPGKQDQSRVFCAIRLEYSLSIYSSRINASQPAPSLLPREAFGA